MKKMKYKDVVFDGYGFGAYVVLFVLAMLPLLFDFVITGVWLLYVLLMYFAFNNLEYFVRQGWGKE